MIRLERFALPLFIGLGAALALFVIFRIPTNSDEFLGMLPLACWTHPRQNALTCSGYDLNLLGIWLPLRSYFYLGITVPLFYAPVFLLFKSYLSTRLVALPVLAALAWLLGRIARLDIRWSLALVFLNFPLIAQTVIDTGPVSFHLLLMAAIPFLAMAAPSRTGAIGAGVLLFLGLEHKAFFGAVLPAVTLLAFVLHPSRALPARERVVVFGQYFGIVLVTAAALSIPYFSAPTHTAPSYLSLLRSEGRSLSDPRELWQHALALRGYFTSFASYLHRVYLHPLPIDWREMALFGADAATAVYWLVGIVWLGAAVRGTLRARAIASEMTLIIASLAGAAASMVLMLRTDKVWAGHHVVLLMPLWVLATMSAAQLLLREGKQLLLWVALPLLGWAAWAPILRTRSAPIPHDTSPERAAIFRALSNPELASQYLYVTDWGFFYQQALYGPRQQVVLNLAHIDASILDKAKQIASIDGRKLLLVGKLNLDWSLQSLFDPIELTDLNPAEWPTLAEK